MINENEMEMFDDEELSPVIEQDELKNILKNYIENAKHENEANSDERIKAYDYYIGEPMGNEVKGRDTSISMDLADSIDALLADITPIYASNGHSEFTSTNIQDRQQSRIETAVVSHMINEYEGNNGFTTFYQAFKDALMYKNGYIKIYYEEVPNVHTDTLYNISMDELQAIVMNPSVEVLELLEVDGIIQKVTIQVDNTKKTIRVEPVPPEEILYDPNHTKLSLQDCPFVAHYRSITKGELISMGFDPEVIMELKTNDLDYEWEKQNRKNTNTNDEPVQEASKKVDVYECFVLVDYTESGKLERRRIFYAGNEILSDEPFPLVPIAVGTPYIQPHSHLGISFYDKLKGIQESKTKIQRQYLDNMALTNDPKIIVNSALVVNDNEVATARPGVIVHSNGDVNAAIRPLNVPDIGPSCINALNYLDSRRTERVGASLDMVGENLQINTQTAHGTERLVSAKENIASIISRTFAETIVRETYLIVHAMMRAFMPQDITIMENDQVITSNIGTWPTRKSTKIITGLSLGERTRQANNMMTIIRNQMELVKAGFGGTLVSEKEMYNALIDFTSAVNIDNGEQYFRNPESMEAKKVEQNKTMANQAQQQMQAQLQKAQTDLTNALSQNAVIKAQADILKAKNQELAEKLDNLNENRKLNIEEEKINMQAALELVKIMKDNKDIDPETLNTIMNQLNGE